MRTLRSVGSWPGLVWFGSLGFMGWLRVVASWLGIGGPRGMGSLEPRGGGRAYGLGRFCGWFWAFRGSQQNLGVGDHPIWLEMELVTDARNAEDGRKMGIILGPLLLLMLAYAAPGIALLIVGVFLSKRRWLTLLVTLLGAALLGGATYVAPYALSADGEAYQFSFLMVAWFHTLWILGGSALVLALTAKFTRRPSFASASAAVFLAVALQTVFVFTSKDLVNRSLVARFRIAMTYN